MNRREFIGGIAAATAGSAIPAFAATPAEMRGALLHFGTHMWAEQSKGDKLNFDYAVWKRLTDRMVAIGMNYVLIDVGEGLVCPSHPELAISGSWDPDRFRAELKRLRSVGLEPLPKLNFSCAHNQWLGPYRKMVSSQKYYEVVHDIVRDVTEIFDRPRLFHIGYDEEDLGNQSHCDVAIIRQGDLWWHDFKDLVATLEKNHARTWMWSDYAWHHDDFFKRCPRSVLQCNWYYRQWFDFNDPKFPKNRHIHLRTFLDIDKAGLEQTVCGSNWATDDNFVPLVKFAREKIKPDLLKGFMMATWEMTTQKGEAKLMRGLDQFDRAMKQ